MTAHISTLKLHQRRYGELSADDARAVDAHLAGCARCAERLGVQQREREAFVLMPVPPAITQVARPQPTALTRWLRWLLPAGGLLAVAAAGLLFALQPTDDGNRLRGAEAPELEAWIGTDAGPRALRPDEPVHAGSTVQLSYDPQGAAYVWLAGRDGTGTVEIYGEVRPLRPVGLQPAPFSLTLDDAPGPQAFFVIRADRPLDDDALKAAVTADVPQGVTVDRLVLPKE